ncbi:flagellar basal body rod protein FlgC [Chitinimonas lacunae]|uniref:Flagellar basal-body rod protein FlgC n=1 Tax=Chitinimonas lacunae TaxID=1963018 RepID=A0ABV8MUZ8_9NEIS
MDYRNAFAVSAAGMTVQKLRLDVTALNLANMQTTRGVDGKPFQPMRVVVDGQVSAFANQFDRLASGGTAALPQVRIETMNVAPRLVLDPGHPDADERGYVSLPGVDHVGEMVNLSGALRTYEANVVALNAAKAMAQKALELGGGQ